MRRALLLALTCLLHASAVRAANPLVRFTTSLGSFDGAIVGSFVVELCQETSAHCPGVAPNTVANFLLYVDEGAYVPTTIIDSHISSPTNIFQGGAIFTGHDDQGDFYDFSPNPHTVAREIDPNLHNVRGALSMVYEPDISAVSNWWFVNVADNPTLDTLGGGYPVFGTIVEGLDDVDAIAAVPTYDYLNGDLPLVNFPGGGASALPYLVYVTSVERVPEPDLAALLLVAGGTLATLKRRAYPARP